MNVLVVHNFYQQGGGEDQVFRAETLELQRHGINVVTHTVHNDTIRAGNQARTALDTLWNRRAAHTLAGLVDQHRSEVVHFHNTFPLISPAAYRAVRSRGAAVVQTLHNYRLLCANSTLFRDGHVCESCLGRTPPWPAVKHACYRGSRAGSGVVAAMLTGHRWLRTYDRQVDLYVALTAFARDKLIEGGLPAAKLVVKPNFLADSEPAGASQDQAEPYALFVGRLAPEKGVATLLRAWQDLGTRLPLRVVGDGPLASMVEAAAQDQPGVEFLGRQPSDQVRTLMQGARLLVFPSEWYEGFPMTLLEAFAAGLPVVASDLGSMPSIVTQGRTGRLFRPGDASDLASQVRWLLDHPLDRDAMGAAARHEFETHYTAQRNVDALLHIYRQAMTQRHAGRNLSPAQAWR